MKKANRKLIPAVVMLLVSAIMLSTASFAWFSMNTTVTATGMKVQAQASGSLVIYKGEMVPKGYVGISADFADKSNHMLTPMTYNSGWKTFDTNEKIDENSGSPNAKLVALTPVANAHYVDYLVYLASAGPDMANYKIQATVAMTGDVTANNAITVAFYNAATADDAATPACNVRVSGAAGVVGETITIPSNVEQAAGTPILMRVYFDGAANDGANAYINSAHVPTEGTTVTVTFTAVAPSPAA